MKKIYKVVVTYGWMTENGMQYNTDWQFFATKKAYANWINFIEETKCPDNYETASAKVYEMTADFKGRFIENHKEIDNFNFTTNKKTMFV